MLITYSLCLSVNAQENKIAVKTTINKDRSINFIAEKQSYGTYTIVLNFNNLTNTMVNNLVYKLKYNSDNFLTLTPTNKDQNISYTYSYRYILGELKPKYNPLFVYTLPYGNGKKVRAAESGFFNATYFGATTPDDWKSYRFYTETADTVVAVRKGTVVSVADTYEDDSKDVQYTSKVNTVIIEHLDGTIATYRGFKKGVFVKEGQVVYPGTPLGINSLSNNRFNISLMITYLKSVDFDTRNNLTQSKSLYGFVTPHFCTEENSNEVLVSQQYYTSAISSDLIQKEMTKKELKDLIKK